MEHLISLFLWAIALILVLRFFAAFRIVALGLLGAAIAAAAMRPLKQLFPGPRWWSALLSALLPAMFIVVLILAVSSALSEPIQKEIARWPEIKSHINDQLIYWSRRLGLEDQLTLKELALQVGQFMGEGMVATTTSALTNALLAVVFIFFGSIYLLGEKADRLLSPVLILLSPARRSQLRAAVDALEPKLRWWLLGAVVAMTVTGLATWLGYWIIGLEFAGALALLAGLAEIVPTFGPLAAFLIALMFAAAKGGSSVIAIVGVYVVIQGLESYILQPFVMKRAVNIPPVVTLFTIVLWSKVFGAPGLILAIPINLIIWELVYHFAVKPRESAGGSASHV